MKDLENDATRKEFIEAFSPTGESAEIWHDEEIGLDVFHWYLFQLKELKTAVYRCLVRCSGSRELEELVELAGLNFRESVDLLTEEMIRLHPTRPFNIGGRGIVDAMEDWVSKAHHAFLWRVHLRAGEVSALQELRSKDELSEVREKAAGLIMDYADYTGYLRIVLEEEFFLGWRRA